MTTARTPRYGFRVLDGKTGRRRLVAAATAFRGYATLDPRAEVTREAYLSAFRYGDDFKQHLSATGSTAGFDGDCWAMELSFDLDHEVDPECSLNDARRLTGTILERYPKLDDDALMVFFSGSKGFHVGLPLNWHLAPSAHFHRVARRLAEAIASIAGVSTFDPGVYDKVRLFRAPNSRHPKTGLHKRRLTLDELMGLSVERIRTIAAEPAAFELPASAEADPQTLIDWREAEAAVIKEAEAKAQRRAAVADGMPRLNRATLDFIHDGAKPNHRHATLCSAAANLAEFGCPPTLAHALLTPAALDCGLTPSDTRRQIDCGLSHAVTMGEAVPPPPDPVPSTPSGAPVTRANDAKKQLAALWRKTSSPPAPESDDRGDAWEDPRDQLGAGDRAESSFDMDQKDQKEGQS